MTTNNIVKYVNDIYASKEPLRAFLNIVNLVTKDMVRGAINPDNAYNEISFDIVDLALVYKGLKPMTAICDPRLRDIKDILDLSYVEHKSILIAYKDEKLKSKAEELCEAFKNSKTYGDNFDQFVGECLGYPQKDIDCFIEKKKIFKVQKIPLWEKITEIVKGACAGYTICSIGMIIYGLINQKINS